MIMREVRFTRIAQLALGVLVVTALSACNGPHSGSSPSTATATAPSPTVKTVTLSWNAPTEDSDGTAITNLAGYTLHYGTTSMDYTGTIQITNPATTTYAVSTNNFPAGTYYFAISAYNTQQVSSALSPEIQVTVD